MPAGTPKVGLFGRSLVAAGSTTFNVSGTFTVPVGVTKVNITGKGASGNPGNPGNAGNPGTPGNSGTGGGGGGGGGGGVGAKSLRGCRCTSNMPINGPTYPGSISGGVYGGRGGVGSSCSATGPQAGQGGGGSYFPLFNGPTPTSIFCINTPGTINWAQCFVNSSAPRLSPTFGPTGPGGFIQSANTATSGNPGTPGSAGNPGSAGQAGNPGTAGNAGAASSGLCKTFLGGAAGNGGNAGSAGAAGNAGAAGTGGSGGVAGQQGTGKIRYGVKCGPPQPNTSYTYHMPGTAGSGGSAGGPGGFPGGSGGPGINSPANASIVCRTTGLTMGGGGGGTVYPGQGYPGSISPIPCTVYCCQGYLGGWNQRFYSSGGTGLSNAPSRQPFYARSTTTNPGQNCRGGGGGGASWIGGGGGGGGAGGAGNPGGTGGTGGSAPSGGAGNAGASGTPATYNCIPVTPGGSYPITIGGTGGQVVISWNAQ